MATKAYADEKLTVTNAVKTFTASVYNGTPEKRVPQEATFSVEDDDIRVRFIGDPASGTGLLVKAGTIMQITGQKDIESFKAIRETTDAIINVEYSY